MKLKIILSITLIYLCKIVSLTDYCELEKYCLNGTKHIGCEKNIYTNPVKPYVLQKMTNDLREFILEIINKYRNDIATGVYVDLKFPKASNMRSFRWNYDFEYLSGLGIQKVPKFHESDDCFVTDDFQNPTAFYGWRIKNYTSKEFIRDVFQTYLNYSLMHNVWTEFHTGGNYQFGCAIAKIDNKNSSPEYIVKYIVNKRGPLEKFDSYIAGEPCTKCNIWNETCNINNKYLGLCEKIEIFPNAENIGFSDYPEFTGETEYTNDEFSTDWSETHDPNLYTNEAELKVTNEITSTDSDESTEEIILIKQNNYNNDNSFVDSLSFYVLIITGIILLTFLIILIIRYTVFYKRSADHYRVHQDCQLKNVKFNQSTP